MKKKKREEDKGYNSKVRRRKGKERERKIESKRQKRGRKAEMPRLSTRKHNFEQHLTTQVMNRVSN
jgi:hypothetical protein